MSRLRSALLGFSLGVGIAQAQDSSLVPPNHRVSEDEARVALGGLLASPDEPQKPAAPSDTLVPPKERVTEQKARLELGRLLAETAEPKKISPAARKKGVKAGATIVPPRDQMDEQQARVELGRLLAETAPSKTKAGAAKTAEPGAPASTASTASTAAPTFQAADGETIVPPRDRVAEEKARLELGRLLAETAAPARGKGKGRQQPALTVAPTAPFTAQVFPGGTIVPPERRVSDEEAEKTLAQLLGKPSAPGAPNKTPAAPFTVQVFPGGTIVPPERRVPEHEARLTFARLLAAQPNGAKEALQQYNRLLAGNRSDFALRRERAPLLFRLKRYDEAAREFSELLRQKPRDASLMADLADVEAARGHAGRSRDLYEQALRAQPNSADLNLRYARQMRAWGDFYESERRFRRALAASPRLDVELDLANVLVASQQYERAEEIYRSLLRRQPGNLAARLGVAEIRSREKDYAAVLPEADAVLARAPHDAGALALKAQALRELGRFDEARSAYARLAVQPGRRVEALIGRGLTEQAAGNADAARALFEQARRSDPSGIAAQYYLLGEGAPQQAELLAARAKTAPDLVTAAGLYASVGEFQPAIALYQRALERDPQYFPARLGLAEMLASNHQYDEALERLRGLRNEFPNNSKILLTNARVLSWARRYDESLAAYRELAAMNPTDVVPVREMARVAAWGKKMTLAQQYYAQLYSPALNQKLLGQLEGTALGAELAREAAMDPRHPYSVYEMLADAQRNAALSPADRRLAARLLDEWLPTYRLQKSSWLEARGKLHAWHLHFLRAEDTLQELTDFQPGNEEALFDLAQAQAAQDLRARTVDTYKRLLHIDPAHTIVKQALEREQIRASPGVEARYFYWDEKGAGRNSDITRHQFTLGGELVRNYQHWLRFSTGLWEEDPGYGHRSARAYGGTLEFEDVWNEYVRTSLSWTHKTYEASDIDDSDTGRAAISINAFDYARLTFAFIRQQEIPNGFALRQGIHINAVEIGLESHPHRYLEIRGAASHLWYSDGNQGDWVWLAPGVILSDHPHTLKLVFRGDYRDTKEESTYFFTGTFPDLTLRDIKHPYWTPQNYLRGQAILEWRHDLSKDYYAGAELHYYALRAGVGTDNTNNDSWRAEAEWRYDFAKVWSIQALGTIERSRQWDGQSVFVSISRRFP